MGGSAEVDGEYIGCWELSSARTTFAGVPLAIQNVKDVLRLWTSATSGCRSKQAIGRSLAVPLVKDRALATTLTSSHLLPGWTSRIRNNTKDVY